MSTQQPTVTARQVATPVMGGKAMRQAAEGEDSLGDLWYFSMPYKLAVPADALRQLAAKHGLPESWLPEEIKPVNAFLKATNALKEDKAAKKAGLKDDKVIRHSVLVRDAPGEPSFRNIVKETRVGTEKPTYVTIGHIQHKEDVGILDFCDVRQPDLVREFEEMRDRVRTMYEHLRKHYLASDIINIINRARKDALSISLRDSGGVYFVPVAHRELLKKLRDFMVSLKAFPTEDGREVKMAVVPLTEMQMDPKDIGSSLVDAVDYETSLVLKEIEEAVALGKKITPDRFARMQQDLVKAADLADHYQDLLRLDLKAADLKVEAANVRLKDLARLVKR